MAVITLAPNVIALIAWVTSHIPDKGQVMIRYYSLYAYAQTSPMPQM